MSREPERLEPLAPTASPDGSPDWLRGTVAARDAGAGSLLTGHLDGIDAEGRLLFLPEGAEAPLPVAIGADLSDGVLVRAVRRRARALVARTSDPTPRWLVVGLVRERVAVAARDAKPGRLEVTVDGERVRLAAEHDIELKCGQASLTLRYDGRIEVRGTHILSASRGPNRVKGATIALN
jgi:hypothetical protein